MATLASYAVSPAVVTQNDGEGEYVVSGGVVNINGLLDGIPDTINRIRCNSGGGIRFRAGANGTLGGRTTTFEVIEEANAHRFGGDNGKFNSTGGGTNSRFGPGVTNTMVFENVRWIVEGASGNNNRSDFDIGQGTNSDGSGGAQVTFRGLHLIMQASTGDVASFNHMYSTNFRMEIHPVLGYGWRITNQSNAHAINIDVPPGNTFFGLAVDNLTPVNNSGGRVVCNLNGRTFTFNNLNTPDITDENSTQNSNNRLILINPVGVPTYTNNWSGSGNNGYNAEREIQRDVPWNFTGATDATGTIKALHQNSHAQAADADGTITSAGVGTIRVKTNYAANQASSWTSLDGFQFYATGLGFEKYYTGSSTINVGNAPATRDVTLTNDAFPNGDAITDYTSTDGADTASEIYRIIKKHELANPTHRTLGESLATIDADGNIDISSNVALNVSTTQSALSVFDTGSSTLTVKVQTGISADKGINSVNFGNRNIAATQIANFAMPTTTSAGTSALVNITAPASYRVGLFGTDGTNHGNHDYSSAGEHSFLLTAASTGTTKIGMGRAGYDDANIDIDTSAGGVFSHTFQATSQQLDALGNALYDSTLTTTGIGIEFNATGQPTWLIPDSAVSVKQLYKVFHDTYAETNGTLFAAFARQQPGILDLGGAIPNSLFLGADAILRRSENSGNDAAVRAVTFGGRGGNRVMGDRGDISLVEQVGGSGGAVDLTEVNTKLDAITANTETLQEQNEHLATSLPLSFHDPLSPLCIVTGLEGQEIIRDTEETDWPLTASGIAGNGDPEAHGVVEFDGNNSHLDYSLNRAAAGETPDLYTSDIIVLMQIRPTSFPSAGQRPLANIGALTLSINNSTGNTAAIHFGAGQGATTTTAQVNLNQWNDLVFVFTQNPDRPNNPRIRVSINGSAQETGNLGADSTLGNNIFGPINSNTENFRLGGHGTGSQTSGFQGQARAIFVHPDNEVFGTDGWDIPTGVYWNSANQLWQGAQLMDRVEGIAVDRIERTIDSIDEKTFTLEEQANAVLRAPFSAGINAGNSSTSSLTEFIKWIAANANTTTPPTAADIWAYAMPDDPTDGSVADVLNSIPTNTYTVPTAAQNASAVWSATTSSNNTDGSMGHRLQETSTHGAPADAPEATDIAEAVRDIAISGAAANSLGATIAAIPTATYTVPTVAQIVDGINQHQVTASIDKSELDRILLAGWIGRQTVNEDTQAFYEGANKIFEATVTDEGRTAATVTIPDNS